MHEKLKGLVLALMKTPPEPEAPLGSPGSIRVFRASRNFYLFNLVKWSLTQAMALLGIGVILFVGFDHHLPRPFGMILRVGEILGLVGLIGQLPLTYFMVRLDYEMRWYIVTDRSLRIRHGIARVREMTMTFANVQQIVVQQGPIQRLLKIADVQVRTAGGGDSPAAGSHGHQALTESMHLGYLKGVDNAEEIRDLMIERLRQFRDAGLGDPDDSAEEERSRDAREEQTLEAAREFLREAQLLRKALI